MKVRKLGLLITLLSVVLTPLYAQTTASVQRVALKKWYGDNERASFTVGSGSTVDAVEFDGTSIWTLKGDGRLYKCSTADGSCASPITTGSGTGWITLGYDGKYLWTIHYSSGDVRRVDPTAYKTYSTINVGSNAEGFAFDGQFVYVATYGGDIKRINPTTLATNTLITLTSCGPQAVAFDGTHLWASCWQSGANKAVRISLGATPAVVNQGNLSGPATTGMAWDGTNMWVSIGSTGKVARIDPSTNPGTVVEVTVAAGDTSARTRGMAFDGNYIWVASNIRYLTRVDILYNAGCTSGYCTKDYDLGSGMASRSVAFDGAHVWTSDSGGLTLFKF